MAAAQAGPPPAVRARIPFVITLVPTFNPFLLTP
jgi:hypothetical protein